MLQTGLQSISLKSVLLAGCVMSTLNAASQSLVQVAFGTVVAGVPASTYNGITANACSSSTAGYLDTLGDGCLATQATLSYAYGGSVDSTGNIYISDYGDSAVRVLYRGGTALAAALVAGAPSFTFTPVAGHMYILGGKGSALTKTNGVYYCSGASGEVALDNYGNGCPVQSSYIKPRNLAVDKDGNIFLAQIEGAAFIRIIYVGGTKAANLITTYNPGVKTPQVGYIYGLSTTGEFVSPRDVGIDSAENLYVSDNGAIAGSSGMQIKKFNGTSWSTYISLSGNNAATSADGDGGPAAAASVNGPTNLFFDSNDNLYIDDVGNNRIRVVYAAGKTPPLYIEGANSTVVTSPRAGYIYTVSGGSTGRTSGSLASSLSLGNVASIGMDAGGNLYFTDSSKLTWKQDATTGVAVVIGGNGASSTYGSASATPSPGVACNGATGGPAMTDAYASGCPATEISPVSPQGRILFDSAGNYYQLEQRIGAADPVSVVREYSYSNQFGSVPIGSSSTAKLAFTPTSGITYTPSSAYLLTGAATSEFYDAGNDLCSVSGSSNIQTCVYNVGFKPSLAGARLGALQLNSSSALLVSSPIGGTGVGPQLAADQGTQVSIGFGLSPTGIGTDQVSHVYVGDGTTGNLYKAPIGGALSLLAAGFNNIGQIAIDGTGTVFVSDTGNNRVAQVTTTGTATSFLSTVNGVALSAPTGVAADAAGNVYVSDTGNNRIIVAGKNGPITVEPLTGLNSPRGLAVDAAGDLYVADSANSRIVKLTAAGVQSEVAVTPALIRPIAVAIDPAGDLYIADSATLNVIEVSAGGSSATTLVGSTDGLSALSVDPTGNVYIAATSLSSALELNRNAITVTFADTNINGATPQVLTLSNTGNSPLTMGSSLATNTDAVNFAISSSTTSGCSPGQSIAPGTGCYVTATFQPTTVGAHTDTVMFPSNAVNAVTALLQGTGVQKIGTSTSLTYSTTTGGKPLVGQAFTMTATITPATNAGAVTGTVKFTIDGGTAQTATVNNGIASVSVALSAGSHNISTAYSGDANYVASLGELNVTAVSPATTTLALALNGAATNATPFTVTATLSSAVSQGDISGSVSFTVDGGSTQTVVVSGNAASATFTLSTGSHTIVATYSGNSYYLTTSNSITVNVAAAGTSSVTLSMQSPIGTVTYGQAVVVRAAISTGNAIASPTGSVVFAVDGVAQSTVPYASSVSATLIVTGGVHNLTAAYSGDNSYAPATGTLAVTVARAVPAIAFTVSPTVSAAGNTFSLATSVTSVISVPSGSVTFSTGATTLGSQILLGGYATVATSTNALSSYTFTASYSGDSNFAPLSVTTAPAGTAILSASSSSLTIPQNAVGLFYLNVNSFFGYSGTMQITCSSLPANSICRPTPSSVTAIANGVQSVQMQIFTNVQSNQAGVATIARNWRGTYLLFAMFALFPLSTMKRRGLHTLLSAVALFAFLSATGCGSDTRQTNTYTTPTGTYSVVISASDGATTITFPLVLTVVPGTTAPRPG